MTVCRLTQILLLIAALPLLSACPDPAVIAISLTPTTATIGVNFEQVYTLTGEFKDGSSETITDAIIWSSSDESVADIDDGVAIGVSAGSVDISAEYGELEAQATLQVTAFAIEGVVLLNGWPLADVGLTLNGDTNASSGRADGRFRFSNLLPGSVTITPALDNYVFDPPQAQVDIVDGDITDLEFKVISSSYPSTEDLYEPDSDISGPGFIVVGEALQPRTLWADDGEGFGDQDWVAVDLEVGGLYEFFTTNLCETCDTRMQLFDSDGFSILDENDDFVFLDSRVRISPPATGTYFLRIYPYSECGVASYALGALAWEDTDLDDFGLFHDCDDNDVGASPDAQEIPADGIDQNCSGVDAPDPEVADIFEANDDPMNAHELLPLHTSYGEPMHQWALFATYPATIHEGADVDYYRFTMPGTAQWELSVPGQYFVPTRGGGPGPQLHLSVFAADGTTELASGDGSVLFVNDELDATDYYLRVQSPDGTGSAWYSPMINDMGVDNDDDNLRTQGWDAERDSDDADADSLRCSEPE